MPSTEFMPALLEDPYATVFGEELRTHTRQALSWGALYLLFAPERVDASLLVETIAPVLDGKPSSCYRLGNGDIIITWKGQQRSTLQRLTDVTRECFPHTGHERERYYDINAQGSALREFIRHRLERELPPAPVTAPAALAHALQFTDIQKDMFHRAALQRPRRLHPQVLVLTDEYYTGKLITSLLGAARGPVLGDGVTEGLALYAKHAPDVLIIDFERPSSDPHPLIDVVRGLDTQGFIALVAPAEDALAMPYGADAFLVKPFTAAKLQALVERGRGRQ